MDNLADIPAFVQNGRTLNKSTVSKTKLALKGMGIALSLSISALGFAEEMAKPARGEADFLKYCASCHGVTGEGNGPVAGSLKNKPPDLTYLHQQETDGAFPYNRVLSIIQGSTDHDKNIRTHGPADMPVWGNVIYKDSGESTAVTDTRLRELTDYVKSIQK